MSSKEKITEILKAYTQKHNISASSVILEEYAEELLANGVIVPPCKVGDKVYYVDVSIEPNDRGRWTTRKRVKALKFHYGILDWIETPIYIAKEEAQQALKECEDK